MLDIFQKDNFYLTYISMSLTKLWHQDMFTLNLFLTVKHATVMYIYKIISESDYFSKFINCFILLRCFLLWVNFQVFCYSFWGNGIFIFEGLFFVI